MVFSATQTKTLRVVHVATQAFPFVNPKMQQGLSEVVGKVPAAQISLGLDTKLILPLFKSTRAIIEKQGLPLEEIANLRLRFGPEDKHAQILLTHSIIEPRFPIYFIANEALFGQDKMFGWTNDLERFAFFCHATMELQRQLGEAPDVFDCHDWQAALIAVYVKQLNAQIEPRQHTTDIFFKDTKVVLGVHDFGFTGAAPLPSFHEAALGWERGLPGWAECFGHLNPLKAGLYQADRAYARSSSYLDAVVAGTYGYRGFNGIAKGLLADQRLVGLCKDDTKWGPDRELTMEHARQGAKHLLGVYRSVVDRAFPGMELAEPTTPPVPYQIFSPRERLVGISPLSGRLYDSLSRKEQALIDQEILAGREDRFENIETEEKFRFVLSFLKIDPDCTFEARMFEAGLVDLLALFFPRDLDRLLSIKIKLSSCEALIAADQELNLDQRKAITLFEALSRDKRAEGQTQIDHILDHMKTLKLLATAANKTDKELAAELKKRGEFTGEESLALATTDFRYLATIYQEISRGENQPFFKAFILAIILHDMGKLIKHNKHPLLGAQWVGKMSRLKGITERDGLDFMRIIVKHHSLFGDAFVTREQDPDDLHLIFDIQTDKKFRDFTINCLFLIGIADMNSIGHKGKLTLRDIDRARLAYHAVLFARNHDDLSDKLETFGFGREREGINRWNRWVVRETTAVDDEITRAGDARIAAEELALYCKKSLMRKIEASRQPKKNGRRVRIRVGSVQRTTINLQRQLGTPKNIFKIEALVRSLDDPRLRARLLIWLSEYSRGRNIDEYILEISGPEQKAALISLLEEFDLAKINQHLTFKYDLEQNSLEISIIP